MTSLAYSVFGQDPSWRSFGCPNSTARWRFLPDGSVEVEGQGTKTFVWPSAVDQWKDQIANSAIKHGVPAAWIAAVMSIESGGNTNACYRPSKGGPCSTKDGAGLMAILQSTATSLEGRPITLDDLMSDPALSIDLGTKYFRGHLDDKFCSTCKPIAGDFVKAAVGYNSGGVRCGSGRTLETKEPCQPTVWGVVMGCTLASKDYGGCSPSVGSPGKYTCPNNYPGKFIQALNTAIQRGWGDLPPNYVPPVPVPGGEEPVPSYLEQIGPPSRFLWMVAAGVAGYMLVLHAPKIVARVRAYR